jgi:curved DNA-binding protein CbpA
MLQDPFDALGLPASFDLDQGEIERAYFARSAAVHPDVAAGDDEAQRRMTILNQAKRTLDDPERRADALLIRLGGPPREQDRSLPPDFLMEIM